MKNQIRILAIVRSLKTYVCKENGCQKCSGSTPGGKRPIFPQARQKTRATQPCACSVPVPPRQWGHQKRWQGDTVLLPRCVSGEGFWVQSPFFGLCSFWPRYGGAGSRAVTPPCLQALPAEGLTPSPVPVLPGESGLGCTGKASKPARLWELEDRTAVPGTATSARLRGCSSGDALCTKSLLIAQQLPQCWPQKATATMGPPFAPSPVPPSCPLQGEGSCLHPPRSSQKSSGEQTPN